MYVTNLVGRIFFENIDDCDYLMQLCMDIYISREEGDLKLEEELYFELIRIYRNPEILHHVSMKNSDNDEDQAELG